MVTTEPAVRLMVFLTEDDRVGPRLVVDLLVERAKRAGLAGATVWQGIEGFGRSGHLRAERLVDLARGLPLVLEIIDGEDAIAAFVPTVQEVAPGALVTLEPVEVSRPPSRQP